MNALLHSEKYLFENLESLQHDNGRKLIQIFGPKEHQILEEPLF